MNKLLKLAKARHLIGRLTVIWLMIVPLLSVSPVVASETGNALYEAHFPSAEAAFESALAAYMGQVNPKHPFEISETKVEGDWAYAVASVKEDDNEKEDYLHSHEFIVLLARREGDAGWLAIAPEIVSAKEYNDWLADFPDSLIDESTRAYLHRSERSESTQQLLNFSSHKLPWPNGQTGYVTRKNGSGHENQIDFDILGGGSSGDVYASKPGTVVFVKESSNSGCCALACWQQANMVVVQHASNEYSWYVHLAYNSVPVSVGQTIGFGTKIGVEGETGYSCGVHLHYMGSTGHSSWTDPNNPNTVPWGTGMTAVDFVEASWNNLTPGLQYTSQNAGSSCCGCALAAQQPTDNQPQSDYEAWLASQLDPSRKSSPNDALLGLAYQGFPSAPSVEIDEIDTIETIDTIDTTPPSAPTDLESESHRLNVWSSERAIDVAWASSQEEAGESGLAGYAYSWDQSPESEPEGYDLLPPNAIRLKEPALADGTWYFHLRALDQAGNASETVHLGPFLIDGTAPELETSPLLLGGTGGTEGGQGFILTNQPQLDTFNWAPASDEGDVRGYYVYWGEDEDGTSETFITETMSMPEETIPVGSAATRYLRIAALDAAGNLSAWQTAATWHYDNVAPTGTLTIGSGGETVRSLHLTLNLEAEDADSAVSEMRFSADGKEWTAWEPYSPRRQWELENHAERQTLYAQVRDEAGNLSEPIESSVVAELNVPAPASTNYQLVRRALTMGGGEKSSNSYTVRGNSGQAHQTGHLQGNNYQVKSGFWGGISQNQASSCYVLTTASLPPAGGSISASPTPNCAGSKYEEGTTVTLTANASSGYTFSHWSGVSGSSNQTSVTMNSNQSVTANFSTSPSTDPVILALSPSEITTGVGQTFELAILVEADTLSVDGASAYLNFDPASLQVASISPGSELAIELENSFDNASGQVNFSAGALSAPFPSGTFTLATVTFEALAETSGSAIDFNTTAPRLSDATFGGSSLLNGTIGSTVIVHNAILVGTVTLQGRPTPPAPRWIVPLNVSLTIPGESTPAYEFTPTTDENGSFTIVGVEPGTYQVRVKKSTTLQNMQTVTLGGDSNSFDFGILREGDANNDNFVTILDFSILAATFAQCEGNSGYDERADFNGDGCVTILDFSLLASNFGQSGQNSPSLSPSTNQPSRSDITMVIEPASTNIKPDETFSLTVRLDAASQQVDGAQATLNFDPAVLEVQEVTAGSKLEIGLMNQFDNQKGTIEFAAGTLEEPTTGTFDLVQIQFRALEAGETPLTFQFDEPTSSDVTFAGTSVLQNEGHTDGIVTVSQPTAITVDSLQATTIGWQWRLAALGLTLLAGGLFLVGKGRNGRN